MKINLLRILFVINIILLTMIIAVGVLCIHYKQCINDNQDIINNSELAKNIGEQITESYLGFSGEFLAIKKDDKWLVSAVEKHEPNVIVCDGEGYELEINSKDCKILRFELLDSEAYKGKHINGEFIGNKELAETIFNMIIKSNYGQTVDCKAIDNGEVWKIDESRYHMLINKNNGSITFDIDK